MIDIKSCRLAVIIMAFATLLQSLTVAGEGYGRMLKRWGRNTWNTSYPVAAQVGTLGVTRILAAVTESPFVYNCGLFSAPLLAH